MLGRMRMSVDDCIKEYTQLASHVFQRKHMLPVKISGKLKARFDSKRLRDAIQDVAVRHGLEKDALLKDTTPMACKV